MSTVKPWFACLLLVFVLSSCSQRVRLVLQTEQRKSTNIEQLDALLKQAPLKAQKFLISVTLIEEGEHRGPIQISAKVGELKRIEIGQEAIYPTGWDPPQINQKQPAADEISFPVIPAIPKKWRSEDVGSILSLTPTIRGFLVQLEGEWIRRSLDDYGLAGGEVYAPISTRAKNAWGQEVDVTLTENRVILPSFTESRSAVLVLGQVGVEHRLHIPSQDLTLLFKVEVVE